MTCRIAPCGEVARAVGVRLRQRLAERGRRAPRPEQDTHDQAHADPDGNVFDPHQADGHPVGWMMLNKITTVSVNAACPPANEMIAGATPARKTASGSRSHSSVVFVPIPASRAAPMMKPATVPGHGANGVLPGVQRIGAQHRQRAEDYPERCWTPVSLAASTASPSPAAPRKLLCNQTECGSR